MDGKKKAAIEVYARIKPPAKNVPCWNHTIASSLMEEWQMLYMTRCRDNSKIDGHSYRFSRVFTPDVNQEEVFEIMGKPVVERVLNGYNGTIFAYGQTGAGKTYSMTGGDMGEIGLIPRALSYMFSKFRENTTCKHSVYLSYLEIYNENGYDLICPRKTDILGIEEVPKVVLMEDAEQNLHLKNVSVMPVLSEDDALALLLLGQKRRATAITPMNLSSTRSHCLFTIYVISREEGSCVTKKSKLHMVDLAGSERVHKCKVLGKTLNEAKSINRALHFLENVIMALGEKKRHHVPYRNSMMTSILRDSLGGNCLTTMLANVSLEEVNWEESVSTCRFSQRVSLVENLAKINEVQDPFVLLSKLRDEVCRLKQELALANGLQEYSDELTEEEVRQCRLQIAEYLNNPNPASCDIPVEADMRKIKLAFQLVRNELSPVHPKNQPKTSREEQTRLGEKKASPRNIEAQKLIRQRDMEIKILIDLLHKEKNNSPASLSSSTDISASLLLHTSSSLVRITDDESDSLRNAKREALKERLSVLYAKGKTGADSIRKCRDKISFLKHHLHDQEASIDIDDVNSLVQRKELLESLSAEKSMLEAEVSKLKKVKEDVYEIQHEIVSLEKDRKASKAVIPKRSCSDTAVITTKSLNKFASHPLGLSDVKVPGSTFWWEQARSKIVQAMSKDMTSSTTTSGISSFPTPEDVPTELASAEDTSTTFNIRTKRNTTDTKRNPTDTKSTTTGTKSNTTGTKSNTTVTKSNTTGTKSNTTGTKCDENGRSKGNGKSKGRSNDNSNDSDNDNCNMGAQPATIMLTGDEETDEDILAFCKARRRVLSHMKVLRKK